MAKKFYWIKLKDDFFSDKRIKKIRKAEFGDTCTIIYQKLMLLSLKTDGIIYFDLIEDSFAEEIALQIDEPAENVRLTLAMLVGLGLAEESTERELKLPEVPMLTGHETDSAERVRRYRQHKKETETLLQCNNNVTEELLIETDCNTEIEKETDINKEIDREIDNQSSYQSSDSPSPCGGSASQYNKVNKLVECYNSNCGSMKKVAVITEEIEIKVNVFLSMHGMDKFYELMERAAKSDFLNGKCESTWKADIVWLLTPNNADKVLEGKYDTYNKNKEKVSSKNIVNSQHEESDEMTEEERERIYRELTE